MNKLRTSGLSHIYLDEKQDKYSNVAVGLLTRAIDIILIHYILTH